MLPGSSGRFMTPLVAGSPSMSLSFFHQLLTHIWSLFLGNVIQIISKGENVIGKLCQYYPQSSILEIKPIPYVLFHLLWSF